jgi:hypothetical protein
VSKAISSEEGKTLKPSEITKGLLFYTPAGAAALLSMSRSRVYVLLSRQRIGSIKGGPRAFGALLEAGVLHSASPP